MKKKTFCSQVAPFLRFEKAAALYPSRRSDCLQKITWFPHPTVCVKFPKLSIKLSKDHRFHCWNPKLRSDLQNQGNDLFFQYLEFFLEQSNRRFPFSFCFQNNKLCEIFRKNFEPQGIQFILTEFVKLNDRHIYNLYNNRSYGAYKTEKNECKHGV